MVRDEIIKILMERDSSLKVSHLKKKLKKELEDMLNNNVSTTTSVVLAMTNNTPTFGATFSVELMNKFNGERGYWTKIIELLLLGGILTKDEIEEVYKLDKISRRIGILSIIEKDAAKMERIYKIMNTRKEEGTDINIIKSLIMMLREYVKVADVEQKKFGEVMTPLEMVKEMISVIPNDYWTNPNLKILDPSNGCGPYPSLVIFKLMNGLKSQFPNEEDRYKHIVENMIYVAELQPTNMFLWMCLVDPFDSYDINIYCGSFLDTNFDTYMKDVWKVEKFDLILTNPPYQEPIEDSYRMKTLYNSFIEKSIPISNKLLYIVPSRWMAGGFDLDDFRKMMFNRNDIKIINHFEDAQEIFGKGVDIKGGVQYLYIDKDYNGLVNYCGNQCKLGVYDIFVGSKYYSILDKTISDNNLSTICKSKSYWMNFNDNTLDLEKNDSNIICYIAKNKGLIKYIKLTDISKSGLLTLDKHKVFTPAASGSSLNLGYFGSKIIGNSNEVCSNTYMTLFVDSELEAKSLISYMNTEFCNFFLSLRKNTQNIKPDTLKWIPLVPFDREWTDPLLFEYFDLTISERKLILE